MREFLKGLELDQETIDTIMAEHGKIVTKDKEELQTLKGQIAELKQNSDGIDWKNKFEELENQIKQQEAQKQAEDDDRLLTNNILQVFGDKKFTSDYAKNGFISDIKTALSKPENKGKGISDLITELSNGKEGIFENPNKQVNLPGANENVDNVITKEAFDKMTYNERVQLKQDNPDLFHKLND